MVLNSLTYRDGCNTELCCLVGRWHWCTSGLIPSMRSPPASLFIQLDQCLSERNKSFLTFYIELIAPTCLNQIVLYINVAVNIQSGLAADKTSIMSEWQQSAGLLMTIPLYLAAWSSTRNNQPATLSMAFALHNLT